MFFFYEHDDFSTDIFLCVFFVDENYKRGFRVGIFISFGGVRAPNFFLVFFWQLYTRDPLYYILSSTNTFLYIYSVSLSDSVLHSPFVPGVNYLSTSRRRV